MIEDYTTRTMAEPILKKYMENTQAKSNPTKPNTDDDINIELNKEFLMELKKNAYHGMFDEDVVDHIAKVLELLDLIKIPGVDSHQLRMKGIDPLEFISRVSSSFENHMKVDGRTKKVLFHSWINGSWSKRRMDSIILNNKEWKESDYGNPLNIATDSFFKSHDKHDIEEGNELRQTKHKTDNKNDEQPNKRTDPYLDTFYRSPYVVFQFMDTAYWSSVQFV
nr:hypothetical protein [Tanacetum cinerariifolium]